MEIKISIISREIIKPSCPSPENHRCIKLSALDQINFMMSTPLILFYPAKGNIIHDRKLKSRLLKASLSKALTLFYPLAGELQENLLIKCNNHGGIEFVEAEVSCFMSDLFHQPDNDFLERLIPMNDNPEATFKGGLIQVSYFACNGFAIAISLTHKTCDAASLGTFLSVWIMVCISDTLPSQDLPYFVSDTIISSFQGCNLAIPQRPPSLLDLDMPKCKTLRFVFDASSVLSLKSKAASERLPYPSRVEAVTAFIWKCLMNVSRLKFGFSRHSAIVQAVNLRKRFVPPLPQEYIGNLSGKFLVEMRKNYAELKDLVVLLRKGLDQTCKDVATGFKVDNLMGFLKEFEGLFSRDDVDLYSFTSLCGYPFYGFDFGWGKPSWMTATSLMLNDYIVFIDTRDGKGIEALISLSEEDASLMEKNQELLEFASLNPIVSGFENDWMTKL